MKKKSKYLPLYEEWMEKGKMPLAKEITRAEYVEGFNIQLDGGILNETP